MKKAGPFACKRKGAMDGGDCSQRRRGEDEGTVMVRVQAKLLCCPTCSQPLVDHSPIYQCNVGHVVCDSCRKELAKQCLSCTALTVYRCCVSVEDNVDSAEVLCVNSSYGCKEMRSLAERIAHEEECMYFPCFCPTKDCDFQGSREMLVGHLVVKHNLLVQRFSYNVNFEVYIYLSSQQNILLPDNGKLVFILQTKEQVRSIAISCVCIRPLNFREPALSCWLRVPNTGDGAEDYDLEFKSPIVSTTFEDGVKNDQFSLSVPLEMFRILKLDVCIKCGL